MVVPSTVWVTKRGSRHHCPNIVVLPPGGRYRLTPFAQVHQPQCSPKRYKVLTRNGLKGISLHKQGNRSRMAGIAIQRLYLMSFCVKQQKCVISRHSKDGSSATSLKKGPMSGTAGIAVQRNTKSPKQFIHILP